MTNSKAGVFGLFRPPADMYLRVDRVDALIEALRSVQHNTESCEQRIAACEQGLDALTKQIQDVIMPEVQSIRTDLSSSRGFMETELSSLKTMLQQLSIESRGIIPGEQSSTDHGVRPGVTTPESRHEDLDTLLAELLRPTDHLSRSNMSALRVAVRDIEAIKLNLKYFGSELAARLREIAPPRHVPSPPMVQLRSKASTQADIESDWVAYWAAQMKRGVIYHRKLWEFCYVLQAIYEHGYIVPGAEGLGFGCGGEPLPSYLAARGVAVTMTDLPPEDSRARAWIDTAQHATQRDNAFYSDLVDRASFDCNVTLRYVDMTNIPNDLRDFDFCWSICALEHLGSIANGLDFIVNSLNTLKPGGLAVHTTEFNCFNDRETIDNWPWVLFQRKHFQEIAEGLRGQGHSVAELDFDVGNQILDKFIDFPPYPGTPVLIPDYWSPSPHLKLSADGFVATCFGLIIRKARDVIEREPRALELDGPAACDAGTTT